jgi:hypothetical protein
MLINPRRFAGNIARHAIMGRRVTPRYIARSILGTLVARVFFKLLRGIAARSSPL